MVTTPTEGPEGGDESSLLDIAVEAEQEQAKVTTFESLAKGQKAIADSIHKDRIRALMALGVFLLLQAVYASFIVNNSTTSHSAQRSADGAQVSANAAQAAVAQIEADRVDRSYGACVQYNVAQLEHREGEVKTITDALRAIVSTPDGEQFIARLEPALRAAADEQYKYRDCSPAGIDKYQHNPPADPATTTTVPASG